MTIDGTVGKYSATTSKNLPVENYNKYSISQQIYTADEIKKSEGGKINSIHFSINKDGNGNQRTVEVYMKHVDISEFSSTSTVGFAANELVYSGILELSNDNGWIEISLDKPFEYDGKRNILVCVNDKTSHWDSGTGCHFDCFKTVVNETPIYRALYSVSDNSSYNPLSSISDNVNREINIPFIQFTFTESGSDTPTAPTAPTLNSPANGATDVLSPTLNFTLNANTSEYKIQLAEANGTNVGEYRDLTNWTAKSSNTVSFQITDWKYNTEYSWKVIARCSDGGTGFLTTESVYTFTTKNVTSVPGNITSVSPDNESSQTSDPVVLSWTFGDNTEEYQVWLGTDANNLTCVKGWTNTNNQNTASYQAQNLDANTYYWKVVVRNGIGETSSSVYSFIKIGAPGNVTPIYPADGATGVSTNATLSWTFAPNTTEYKVLWYLSQYSSYDYETDWLPVPQSMEGSYQKSGLSGNTTYKWAIEVRNNAGERVMYENGNKTGDVTEFSFTTSDIQSVSYASPINNTVITTETATLNWNYGSQNTATHYQVLLGTNPERLETVQDWTERESVGTGYQTSGSFPTEALEPNTKYYWQVNIKKGETIVLGEVVSFISKLDNPVTTENAIYCYPGSGYNATATVTVTWNTVNGAAGYRVYLNDILAGNTTDTKMSVLNLTFNNGNANVVKVVAVYNIDGEQYESSGAMVSVYVSGYIKVSGTISNAYNNNRVSGATVKYIGSSVLADDDEQTVIFTTNGNGAFEGYIPAGTYTMNVQADNYKDYTGGQKSYNYTTEYIAEDAKILSNIPDDVTDFAYDEQPNPLLTWKFAENTTHYRVALSTNQEEAEYKTEWLTTDGKEEGSFKTSGLTSGTTYYVYINVRNINATPGDRALYDDAPLDTVNPKYYTFTTSSVFPATLEAPANNATIENPTVTLQWQYVGDATKYQVCYRTDADNLTALGWKGRSEIEGGTGGYKSEDEVTIEGLSPATTYYWKVQVKKDGGNVVDSEVRSFTTIGAPEAVTNMQPSNGNTSLNADPNLSWAFGENTKEYQLLFGTTNPPTDVEVEWTSTLATSYQTSGLKANVTYYWQVNVRNGFGETEGTVYSFMKPGIPENVEPIDPTDGATGVSPIVTLTWRFAPNTKYYRVLFDDGSGLAYKVGNKDTWIDVTTEIATFNTESLDLEANETYSWVVDVKNDEGQRTKYQGGGGPVAEYSFTTTDKTAVKNEAPLDNAIMTTTTAELQWEYGTGNIVNRYQVYLGKDKDDLEAVTGWVDRGGTEPLGTYTTATLDNDTRYYWRVDVKYGDDVDVIPGKIGTFVSLLTVPENLTCPENVYPDTPFKISWDPTAKATSYNIYVGGMVVANTTETAYSYTMTDANYDMTDGHNIQVTAVYEGLGESQKTAAANVKVTGYGTIQGLVHNVNGESVVGVTITLEGTDEFSAEQTITGITTNSVGYFEAKVLAGTYTLKISDATGVYKEYTVTEFELSHKVEKNFNTIILSSDYIYTFSLNNQKASSVMILLSGGTDALLWKPFDVIVEKDGKVVHTAELVTASFSAGYGYGFEYSGVWNMPSGSYRIGIRKGDAPENAVTWKNYNRNYHVFIQDGDWNEPSNWNNGVVPNNSEVHILKAAYIKAGDVVNTSGNVIIEGTYLESSDEKYEGSLKIDGTLKSGGLLMQATFINQEKNACASVEINGSLVTDKIDIDNDVSYTNFVLNDGGQFRQIGPGDAINSDLNGVFNMNIKNPKEWSPQNKTGWQFISSPFQDAKISKFAWESEGGDYDLYRYDGTNTNEEWLNDKDQNGVTEEEFIQGRAYLASYQTAKEVELTGSFYTNNAYDFTQNYTFTHNPEGNLENFHLIGNPFTFDMDWTNIQKRGVVEGYAVVNDNGVYEYYNSGTIKVGDGFFVKTTSSTVQFEYTDNYTATRNREKSNSINIKLKSKSGNDNVIVSFDGREEGFTKLDNFNDESAVISVVDNDRRYAIVNYDEDVKEVELAFEASKMGVYTIEIEPDGDFDKIILVDRFTGEETDMLNGIYKFTASNQDDYNRFLIKLGDGGQEPTEEGDFVYQSGEELILKGKGVLQIVDVMGRVVYAEEVFNDVNRIDISALRDAAYIVRVIGEEGVKVKKVVVY